MIVHAFSCYTLRLADLSDLELARAWTNRDPDHAGRVLPHFWIEQGEGLESWLLSDKEGPVYFFKGLPRGHILEVHVQFPPFPLLAPYEQQARHKKRMSLALIEGMRWLEQRVHGFGEVRFDSRNPSLIRFAERHLGFVNHNGLLYKQLPVHGGA